MHVASFDDGSQAALHMFAEEMLDLWLDPSVVDGTTYRVVVGQILMDDKGRESFCGVQGATSLAGCNICHFEGRTFANRRVFDGARRYCATNDPSRLMNSNKNMMKNFHFSRDELLPVPKKRTYAEYKEYARIAEDRNRNTRDKSYAHKGVKKLWSLHILPYAEHIHKTQDMMHCMNNVITDCNNSLRPTNSGDTNLYKFNNRTTQPSVISACQDEGKLIYVYLCQFMFINILCSIMSKRAH
jgi:hypothetical protein